MLVWQILGNIHKFCPISSLAHSQGNRDKASLWEAVRLWGQKWCSFSLVRSGSPSAFPALCLPTLISSADVILQSYSGSQEITRPLQGGPDQRPRWQGPRQTVQSGRYQEAATWMPWRGSVPDSSQSGLWRGEQKDIEKLVLCFLPLLPVCTSLFSFQEEANNVEKQCGWGTFTHHSKFMG